MDIIQRLETYRLEKQLTQKELAEKLGVAFCTVNRWLRGKTKEDKISKLETHNIQNLLAGKPVIKRDKKRKSK